MMKTGIFVLCLFSPLLFNIVLEVQARVIWKIIIIIIIGRQIGKEKLKLYLFADGMILYIENPKESPQENDVS